MSTDLRSIVNKSLRNEATPEEREVLESDVDAWWAQLSQMKKSAETQLAAKRDEIRAERMARMGRAPTPTDVDAEVVYATWRASSIRFKNVVEAEMINVALLRQRRSPDAARAAVIEERDHWHARVRELEQAIRHHRENGDEALWSVLGK